MANDVLGGDVEHADITGHSPLVVAGLLTAIRDLGSTPDLRQAWHAVAGLCATKLGEACLISIEEDSGERWEVARGAEPDVLRLHGATSRLRNTCHAVAPHHLVIPVVPPPASGVSGYEGSLQVHWFSEYRLGLADLALAQIVVDHAVTAIQAARTAEQLQRDQARAAHLETALATNRDIGMAMGIVMARHLVSADEAFNVLRRVSQLQHRKLRDVAGDVVLTGCLPELPAPSAVVDVTVSNGVAAASA
ncbi:MAG: ANTAR domain-containing protein [Actinomycetes bacterium]